MTTMTRLILPLLLLTALAPVSFFRGVLAQTASPSATAKPKAGSPKPAASAKPVADAKAGPTTPVAEGAIPSVPTPAPAAQSVPAPVADLCKPDPAAKYAPTEVQCLRLKILQDQAVMAQQPLLQLNAQAQQAQQVFQGKLKELTDEADAIKRANGWPASVLFDPNQNHFSDPPPAPAKDAPKP